MGMNSNFCDVGVDSAPKKANNCSSDSITFDLKFVVNLTNFSYSWRSATGLAIRMCDPMGIIVW